MQRRTFLAASTAMATASMLPNATRAQTSANLLTNPWPAPYGGVPPFDKVKVAEIGPAMDAAIVEELAEVDAIANNPAAPTFENTIGALEKTGGSGDRVGTISGVW